MSSSLIIIGDTDCVKRNLPLLESSFCYSCRSSELSSYGKNGMRTCGYCGAVQDFLMPPCPFVGCVAPRVPTFCVQGKTPGSLVEYTYFCCNEHAKTSVRRDSPPRKRVLEVEEEVVEVAEKKQRVRAHTTQETREDLKRLGFSLDNCRTILRTVKNLDCPGAFHIPNPTKSGDYYACHIESAFGQQSPAANVTQPCYGKWRLRLCKLET